MATRYVWDKYSKEEELIRNDPSGELTGNTNAGKPELPNSMRYGVILSPSYKTALDGSGHIVYRPSGNWFYVTMAGSWSVSEYPYAFSHSYYTNEYIDYSAMFTYVEGATEWSSHVSSTTVYLGSGVGGGTQCCSVSLEDVKGDFIARESSASTSAYPNDGASGSYWYQYVGSDNIDPTSITYPTADLGSGQSITVSISRNNSIQYGGTISYKYQYRRNGGNWTALTTTTDTFTPYTIPDGTTSIQFRVLASDNMGFTSTTYVTGALAEIAAQFKAYIGINNTARQITKIYIGVNGKSRQVVKGYIGINGKARQFL